MPLRPLRRDTVSPTTAAMFDVLVDGLIHPTADVLAAGVAACLAYEAEDARRTGLRLRAGTAGGGAGVADERIRLSGARDIARNRLMIAVRSGRVERLAGSHRMFPDACHQWRSTPAGGDLSTPAVPPAAPTPRVITIPDAPDPDRSGRMFGGMSEAACWASSPLITRQMVHFKSDYHVDVRDLTACLPEWARLDVDDTEGLYRVWGRPEHADGDLLQSHVEQWFAARGIKTRHLKVERNVRRRDLTTLPPGALADLCAVYGALAQRRIYRHLTSLRLHIPDPDDARQQVNEWVLKAIAIFDADKGTPFGAFLTQRLGQWVHDLGRSRIGRTAADAELGHRRDVAAFTQEHHHTPTDTDLAEYTGQTVTAIRKRAQTVATLHGLRNPRTLTATLDDPEIPLPADAPDVDDLLITEEQQSLVGHVLTSCCSPDPTEQGVAADVNVLGWVAWYFTMWRGMNKTDLAAGLGTSLRNLNVYAARVERRMGERLAGVDGLTAGGASA